jgi:hypothetical protein
VLRSNGSSSEAETTNLGIEPDKEPEKEPSPTVEDKDKDGLKLPSAYGILFGLICMTAVMTWLVPAGAFTTQFSEALGRHIPVSGTYHLVPPAPQGVVAGAASNHYLNIFKRVIIVTRKPYYVLLL